MLVYLIFAFPEYASRELEANVLVGRMVTFALLQLRIPKNA